MRAGTASFERVHFQAPADGIQALTWQVSNEVGAAVGSGSETPVAGAISYDIPLTIMDNTLALGALWGTRELAWQFDGNVGFIEYSLEGRVPFGATPAGVRTKLGLGDANELLDEEIPLLQAYLKFRDTVGSVALAAASGDLVMLNVCNAIEAMAGLALLPTLQVRVAQKESSGTNQFARFNIEWEALAVVLRETILEGQSSIDPTLAGTASGLSLLQLATPTIDLFPGA